MAMRRCRNRSNDLIHGGRWWWWRKRYTLQFQTTVTWEWAQVRTELRFLNVSKCVFTTRFWKQLSWIATLFKYSGHFTINYSSWTVWGIESESEVPFFRTSWGATQPPIRWARVIFQWGWLNHEADSSATPSTKVWGYIFKFQNNMWT